jgi:hypothetical protein
MQGSLRRHPPSLLLPLLVLVLLLLLLLLVLLLVLLMLLLLLPLLLLLLLLPLLLLLLLLLLRCHCGARCMWLLTGLQAAGTAAMALALLPHQPARPSGTSASASGQVGRASAAAVAAFCFAANTRITTRTFSNPMLREGFALPFLWLQIALVTRLVRGPVCPGVHAACGACLDAQVCGIVHCTVYVCDRVRDVVQEHGGRVVSFGMSIPGACVVVFFRVPLVGDGGGGGGGMCLCEICIPGATSLILLCFVSIPHAPVMRLCGTGWSLYLHLSPLPRRASQQRLLFSLCLASLPSSG